MMTIRRSVIVALRQQPSVHHRRCTVNGILRHNPSASSTTRSRGRTLTVIGKRLRLAGLTIAGAALTLGSIAAQNGRAARPAAYTTWRDYGGSADSAQYTALKQINKSN